MRKLITQRILDTIDNNGGSKAVPQQASFNNLRWQRVAERMHNFKGGDSTTKDFKRSLKDLKITQADYEQLSDEQLTEIFELVIRRSSVCM